MFAKVRNRHERSGSTSTVAPPAPAQTIPLPSRNVGAPLVSPLQMTFDFELDPPNTLSVDSFRPSSDSVVRPQTSDGLGIYTPRSTIGLQPPSLPPIPRIASRQESVASSISQPSEAGLGARHESDNVSALSVGSRKSTGIRLMPSRSFEHPALPPLRDAEPVELLPTSGPMGPGMGLEERTSTSTDGTTPRMQASIFPSRVDSQKPVLPVINSGPAMTREFIDSRDKPYSHPSARQSSISSPAARPNPVQSSQSMPFMSSVDSPVAPSPHSPTSNAFFNQAKSPSMSMPLMQSPNTLSAPASSPMASLQSPNSYSTFYSQSPASPHMPTPSSATSMYGLRAPKISGARLSPNSSVEDLRILQRSSTSGTTMSKTYTLSDAPMDDLSLPAPVRNGKSNARNSAPKAHSPSAHSPLATIGTPYQETSPSFPLPQHVSVRPKTSGGMSKVAGVDVPTHHTTGQRPTGQRPESASGTTKPEKRKTRLLNPMALLSRRKSAQESEDIIARERSAAAAAYARQRSVAAAAGVKQMPADFDPRIKGNKVHDFSAPRQQPRRNMSYNDADQYSPPLPRENEPSVPFLRYDPYFERQPLDGGHSKQPSDSSSVRRSVHSPMFREMLGEDPDATKRISSLNAERLENKEFLQRVSHHSSNSAFSQDSNTLPPFARRSQVLDTSNHQDLHRSSDPSNGRERDSKGSSNSEVSPITQRNSAQQAEMARHSPNYSLSPVSPNTPDKTFRPISAVSDLPPPRITTQSAPNSPEKRGRTTSEATTRPFSVVVAPAAEPVAESPPLPTQRARSPYRNSADAPEAMMVTIPDRKSSRTRETLDLPIPLPGRTSDLPTPELTPEIGTASSMRFAPPLANVLAPKLVEKRASAVGHARRSSAVVAKHRVSNASRFSFQFNESTEEVEQALEEKHRKIKGESAEFQGVGRAEEEEEEDDFDESAMDDMDELEVQEQQRGSLVADPPTEKIMSVQKARQQLRADDSDDGSVYDEEEDEVPNMTDERRLRHLTWAEHPAMRAHSALASHSRNASQATTNQHDDLIDQYMRDGNSTGHRRADSSASALTLDTNLHNAGDSAFVQDAFSDRASVLNGVGGARPRSGFYMQPTAAGYSPNASPQTERPPLPHRESGNSERNRAASGMSFGSANERNRVASGMSSNSAASQPAHAREASKVSSQGIPDASQRGTSSSAGRLSEARTDSSGLGLSGFSDFNFSEGPDITLNGSRPTSYETLDQPRMNRRIRDSETLPQGSAGWAEMQKRGSSGTPLSNGRASSYFSSPDSNPQNAAYRASVPKALQPSKAPVHNDHRYADSDSDEDVQDDMYFDDGGFEQDIRDTSNGRYSLDEDEFDNPNYLGGANRHNAARTSAVPFASLGGDGPYPSFAMGSNPVKARVRESQMLLQDLPLGGPVDPKLIPQRNPSEDAKRLGLSNKVPPLPPQVASPEALSQMQVKMQAYHASLADALNKAAADGRFARQPSISTARTLSVASGVDDDQSRDDRSHYSREENGADSLAVPNGGSGLDRSISDVTTGSKMNQSLTYSPPKMSFDFGFGDVLTNDSITDDYEADDDVIAAANAEALASDDDGFYGQEFGFYANARPNSGEMSAINGGYFGEDGDDGLMRKKSWKDPSMTPISERTEFSTRNSIVLGHGAMFGPPSAGLFGPASPALARLPISPLAEHAGDITTFDQLRKLRGNAFAAASTVSLHSDHGKGATHGSPTVAPRSASAAQGYFGALGGSPIALNYSPASSGSNSNSAIQNSIPGHLDSPQRHGYSDSPQSANSGAFRFNGDNELTPRKPQVVNEPTTARKVPPAMQTHSRKGSDSVTYVREQDPNGGPSPRWVLERRRTSEQGQLELIGREVVQGDHGRVPPVRASYASFTSNTTVMDPFTALGAASSCIKLANATKDLAVALYTLYDDTKKINETVKALAEQVESLHGACQLVHAELVPIIRGAEAYDAGGQLWSSVGTELDHCNRSIEALGTTVAKVEKEHTTFARQLGRQIKLNWSKEQMIDAQRRIANHSHSLQLIMLVVNIKVTHIGPSVANQILIDKLDKLEVALAREQKVDHTISPSHSGSGPSLVGCAEQILSSGATLYEASVAAGSVQGGGYAAKRNVRVAEWAETLSALQLGEETFTASDIPSETPTTFSGDSRSHTEATSCEDDTSGEVHVTQEDTEDDDLDNVLDRDMAAAALHEGSQAFDLQQWEDAEILLKDSLTDLNRLKGTKRSKEDLFELRYKLSVCAFHTSNVVIAQEALLSFVEQVPSSDAQRRRVCDVGHLLAQLYMRIGSSELALSTCENVLRARLRLLGKQSNPYYESLALMAAIHEACNNKHRARVALAMIPESRRDDLLAQVKCDDWLSPSRSSRPSQGHSTTALNPLPPMEREMPTAVGQGRGDLHTTNTLSIPKHEVESALTMPQPSTDYASDELQTNLPNTSIRTALCRRLSISARDDIEAAIITCDHESASFLIDTMRPDRGRCPRLLHIAALLGDDQLVRGLLDLDFPIDGIHVFETSGGYQGEVVPRPWTSLDIAVGANWLPVVRTLLGRGASLNPHYKKSQWDDARRQWMSPAWSECRPCLAPEEPIGILNLLIRSSTKPAMSDDIIVGGAGWGLCDLLYNAMRSIESEPVRTAVVKDILSRDDQLLGLQGYCPVIDRPGYQLGQQGYHSPLFSAISWVRPELVRMVLQVKTQEQLRLRGFDFMDALMTVTHDFLSAHYGAVANVPKAWNPQRLDIGIRRQTLRRFETQATQATIQIGQNIFRLHPFQNADQNLIIRHETGGGLQDS
ncbi:hypothetical protein LTR17_003819 [Elasticomyces elasticus]|nr:hypothetical protein LTR17_003819 [Elasticomyces elasticus]